MEKAIENLSFLKDYTKIPEQKDRNIGKFLINTAKNNPNFQDNFNLVKESTDLFYRPLTIDDFFIKEINPRTLKQNTILSYLSLVGRMATGHGQYTSPEMFRSFLNDLNFFLDLLKSLVKTDEDELKRIEYINQMIKFTNRILGIETYESVLGSINRTKYIEDFDKYIDLIVENGFDINAVDIKHDLNTGEINELGNMLTYIEDDTNPELDFEVSSGDNQLRLTKGAIAALKLKEKGIDDKHRPSEIEIIRSANGPPLYHIPVSSRNQRKPYRFIDRKSVGRDIYNEAISKRENIYNVLQALARMGSKQKLAFGKIMNDENTPDEFYDFLDIILKELNKYDAKNPFLGNKTFTADDSDEEEWDIFGKKNTLGERLLLEDKYQKGGKRKTKKRKKTKKKSRKKSRKKSKKKSIKRKKK